MIENTAIRPFPLAVPQADLDDLATRLRLVRWPDRETGEGWFQGVPLDEMKALCDHWRHRYDWRRCEAQINRRGSSVTKIDGLDIHFLHVRSPVSGATPATRSVRRRTSKPSAAASSELARTQWSVAMPITSTWVTARACRCGGSPDRGVGSDLPSN